MFKEANDTCAWVLPIALPDPIRIPCASFPACSCKCPSFSEGSQSLPEEASDCHPRGQSLEEVSP